MVHGPGDGEGRPLVAFAFNGDVAVDRIHHRRAGEVDEAAPGQPTTRCATLGTSPRPVANDGIDYAGQGDRRERRARRRVAPAVAAEQGAKPRSWKLPGTNTSMQIGGYAKLDINNVRSWG